MDELQNLRSRMERERPAPWKELPDIALYMDQLISYMPRQLIRFDEGNALTPAMVNNYIKDGLVPRAQGKKYGREHLVYLTVVAAVKQVLSVRDMKALLTGAAEPVDPQRLYQVFQDGLDEALRNTVAHMRGFPQGGDNLSALALSLALRSYADALACRRVVELLRPQEEDKKKKKSKDDEPV